MNLPGKRASGAFYHGSSHENIRALRPNSYGIVFLAKTPKDAGRYGSVVYEVRLSDSVLFDGRDEACLRAIGVEGSVEDNQLWSSEYVEDWFLQEDMKAAGYDGFLVSDCRGDEDGINVGVYDPAKVTIVKRLHESTDNFKKWFKDSVIVDQDGSPKKVYHGTKGEIDRFDPEKSSPGWHGFAESFFFSERPTKDYGGTTIEVYLSLQNPMTFGSVMEFVDFRNEFSGLTGPRKAKRALIDAGFDGVVIKSENTTFIAFYPNQVKAIDNNGEWNTDNDRIKENIMGTQQLQDYVSGIRKELQGVDELAGLDHQMAILCLAIWNMKLARTEEDPTQELIDLWNESRGNYCTSDGRRPGKKEAEALRPLIQEFNDIIADMEENRVASERVRESFPHKNAIDSLPKRAVKKDFCRDINSKRLVTGNRVNTPDGEGDIEKISGTHGEYFVTVNGTDYKATDCYRVKESRENPEFVRIARVREAEGDDYEDDEYEDDSLEDLVEFLRENPKERANLVNDVTGRLLSLGFMPEEEKVEFKAWLTAMSPGQQARIDQMDEEDAYAGFKSGNPKFASPKVNEARVKFSYRPSQEALETVEKMVDDDYGCNPSAEYSEREHEIQVTVMAGSSIRKGVKKAFKAAKLDKNFNLSGMYFMPAGDEHMYCVPQFSDKELTGEKKKEVVKAPTIDEIVSEAVFDADKWLRLDPEELEGLSARERRDSIEASVDPNRRARKTPAFRLAVKGELTEHF